MNDTVSRFRKHIAAISFLVLAAASATALEVREGRVKLVLHEDLGRFSLYYLTDLQKGAYAPLFVDTDPRTSSTTLVVDNRVSRLGESADYQQEARRTAKGAEFVWSSRLIQVQQSLEFVTSAASQLADGVRVTVTVKNLGEQRLQVGLRFLLDTYFGEEGTFHFVTDGQKQVTRETELTGGSRPAYWTSVRQNDAAGLGLVVLTSGDGIDTPERIVFANWQRLNDSSWSYQTSGNRSFSNLPYSINDSAAAMYYGPRTVESGQSIAVSTILASAGAGAYKVSSPKAGAAEAKTTPELLSALASTSGISDPLLAAKTDLMVLDALLRAVDTRLANPAASTEQELQELRSAARELATRIRKYAAEQTPAPARP